MNSRRYPRTLEEAFGPYTVRRIDEPAANDERRHRWPDRIVAAIGVGVLLWVFAHWLKGLA